MIGIWIRAAVMTLLLVPSVGHAGWFGGSEAKNAAPPSASSPSNAVKRLHLKIKDAEAEKELLQLVAAKRIVMQERTVLLLLLDEKKANLVTVEGEMGKTFGVQRDKNYLFDAKARTLSEEPDKTAAGRAKAKVVKTLKDDAEARQFASLASIKQTLQEDLTVLARIVQEKDVALGRINESMNKKFSMSRDMNYWYDPGAKSLYEVVNPSTKGDIQ